MMSVKSVIEDLFNQGFNEGKLEIVGACVCSDVVHSLVGSPDMHGLEGMKQYIITLRTAFPDLHEQLDEIIAEDDKAVLRGTLSGTHLGVLRDIPATGNKITMPFVTVLHFRNDKISRAWTVLDRLEYMQQLGVIPRAA